MRSSLLLLTLLFAVVFTSCRSDFDFEPSEGGLVFSRDTVYLDTVFSNIGSSTYRLKVYNTSNKNISIGQIRLGRGLESRYRLMIDGMQGNQGKIFENVEMLSKDSLYIFIETTADISQANPTDFLYTDEIVFQSTAETQKVALVTLIKDAVFLYPQRFEDGTTEGIPIEGSDDQIYGFYLDETTNGNEFEMTAQKPYVVYGFAAVPTGKTLSVHAGAQLHFHENSGLLVLDGGRIEVNGTLENPVVFEGDRLEPGFSEIPGQWGWIWLSSGSGGHFENCTIKNGTLGLYIQNTTGAVLLKNTQIYNSAIYGIYAQTGTISGENVVINSAGSAALACTLGGFYDFRHSTFNNNWPSSSQFSVWLNNYYEAPDGQRTPYGLHAANFTNCIIFGSNQVSLLLDRHPDAAFTYNFTRCQIKFSTSSQAFLNNPLYDFINDATNIIKNGQPRFANPSRNDLRISPDSDAAGFGINNPGQDILGHPRSSPPDLGAYTAEL